MNKRQILEDSKELFKYLADSQIRKTWIENDIINNDYYYNKQWNNHKDKVGLEQIGCDPITVNRIKPIIDRYLSILIKSGKRVGFLPTTNSQYHFNIANYIKNWAFNVQSQNNHSFASSLKCQSALSSGIGWSHFYYENNRFWYEWVNSREMYFDPDDLSPRLENQNVIARSYFVNVVKLKNLYPKYVTEFDNMVANSKNNQYTSVEDFTAIPADIWVNGKSIRIVELYEKRSDKYFESTCDIPVTDNNDRQIDNTYKEFDDTIFTTFNEDLEIGRAHV